MTECTCYTLSLQRLRSSGLCDEAKALYKFGAFRLLLNMLAEQPRDGPPRPPPHRKMRDSGTRKNRPRVQRRLDLCLAAMACTLRPSPAAECLRMRSLQGLFLS